MVRAGRAQKREGFPVEEEIGTRGVLPLGCEAGKPPHSGGRIL